MHKCYLVKAKSNSQTKQDAVGDGRLRHRYHHLANWTKHVSSFTLTHSFYYVKYAAIHKTGST